MTDATPEVIERDLEQTRARLDATIDALQQKLSPGEMIDQAIGYLKESGGGEMGRSLLETVRQNPVPVALAGIGIAWLMVATARGNQPASASASSTLPRRERSYAPVREDWAARDHWEDEYRTSQGAYASAAIEDYESKLRAAETGITRDPVEDDEAYQDRLYAARGEVFGLRRDQSEAGSSFRERVDAAASAAAERYRAWRASAGAMSETMAAQGQSAMQNVTHYGRAAAEGAYDYARGAAGTAYGYGHSAYETGSELGGGVVRHMRDNPLPWALIGAGAAWLLVSGRLSGGSSHADRRYQAYSTGDRYAGYGRSGYGSESRDYGSAGVENLADRAQQAGAAVQRGSDENEDVYHGRVYAAKGAVLGLAQNVGETLSGFRERVDAAMGAAAEHYRSWFERGSAAGSNLVQRGRSAALSAYDRGTSAAGRGYSVVQDQPMLLGAAGVAIGAILGLLIPPTRYERELVGDMGEDVRERLRGAASEAAEGVSRVAQTVVGAARDAAEREGLTDLSVGGVASAARERVQDVASRARHVVEEAAAAGRDAVQQEVSGNNRQQGNGSGQSDGGQTRNEPAATSQTGSHAGATTGGVGGSTGRTPA